MSSSSTSHASSSSLPSNITNSVNVRLDRNNYPLWLAQIVPLLRSHQRFASQNQQRIVELRTELVTTKRGDLSISDFLDKIHSIADNLSLSGSHISDEDLVSIIMSIVGHLYENTVASVQARETPISYAGLEALLLSAERRLTSIKQYPYPSDSTVVMKATRGGPNNRDGRGFPRNNGGRGGVNNFSRGFNGGNGFTGWSSGSNHTGFGSQNRGLLPTPRRGNFSSLPNFNPSNGPINKPPMGPFPSDNRIQCQIY
ncbi:hypothetical protein CISIN_1g040231mg [Citrus sinensis]|uniref:Retrotransposon Copia-like N-terminal domain-containing protein n=1 Tax=Citrus sinensis TaxID=2711 RepID=A0A067D7Q7_CITSI|nr:hypothetical protein CISIN_1g040231mg [Citrus sinensis]